MPTHAHGCPQAAWQLCLGCGAQVCGCRGLARGQCPHCYRGLLTGYYKVGTRCGYTRCDQPAVASSPRVGLACFAHSIIKGGYAPPALPAAAPGHPTSYTQIVLSRFGFNGDW